MRESTVTNTIALTEMNGKIDTMLQKIETVKEKQEGMHAHIVKIKEAVYNPDEGLYARLRELESWKDTSSRLLWLIITAVITLTVATAYKSFIS